MENERIQRYVSLIKAHRLALIYVGVVLLLIPLSLFFIASRKSPEVVPTPTPSPTPTISITPIIQEQATPLQETTIGRTTEQELSQKVTILKREVLPNGQIQLEFESPLIIRPNQVIVNREKVAIFERVLIPESSSSTGYTTISQMIEKYGQPERIIRGSKFYNWNVSTYIYPQRGIAFIGNSYTNEVYEIHAFEPQSLEQYIRTFGNDIDENVVPEQEKPPPNL